MWEVSVEHSFEHVLGSQPRGSVIDADEISKQDIASFAMAIEAVIKNLNARADGGSQYVVSKLKGIIRDISKTDPDNYSPIAVKHLWQLAALALLQFGKK